MGVVGRAGGVGATGVTGVGGMLESLRLSWLCSAGLQPRPFPTFSLLLAFWEGAGMASEVGRPRTQHHPNHPGQGPSEVTHHLGWGLGLLLKGFPGFGSSGLGLMDPLCMNKTRKSSWGSCRPIPGRCDWSSHLPSPTKLTKLLLTPVAVQVDPELAANVILDAWVLLIMEPIQSAAHHRVHLWGKAASKSAQERSWQLQNIKTPVDPATGTPPPQMNGNQHRHREHMDAPMSNCISGSLPGTLT